MSVDTGLIALLALDRRQARVPADAVVRYCEERRSEGSNVAVGVGEVAFTVHHLVDGDLCDSPTGLPAWESFFTNGRRACVVWRPNGVFVDRFTGIAAVRTWYPNGAPCWEMHFADGERQDSYPATSTRQWWPNGDLR